MTLMEKLDRKMVLHSLSCSPKRVWPASNWEIQGWRDFWRRAKSPVKRRKLQSTWHLSHHFFLNTSHTVAGSCHILCEHVPVVIPFLYYCRRYYTCEERGVGVGMWCLTAKKKECLRDPPPHPTLSLLSNAYPSTHSDHEGNGADHLQNEGDT